jgi:hypothetical protein
MTVEDKPKSGRGKLLPTRFQVFEADPTAHLTDEQKKWKVVKLRPARQHFAVLEQQPTLALKLHLLEQPSDIDQVALAASIFALIQALSTVDRELGGGGFILSDQQTESRAVVLILRYAKPEGAFERAAKLASILNNTVQQAKLDPGAGFLKLLCAATSSSVDQFQLLLAGSRTVSRCEILTAV